MSQTIPSWLPGTAVAVAVAAAGLGTEVTDMHTAREAGAALLAGEFDVYASMPEAQMGPLALGLAGLLPQTVFVLLVAASIAVFLGLAARVVESQTLLTVGGIALAVPWAHLALTGHADDAIVIIGAVLVVGGIRRASGPPVVGGLVLAALGKPTAALLLGLVGLAGPWVLVTAATCAALAWLPFVLADVHGFLAAGGGIARVMPFSLPDLLGASPGEAFPAWIRPTQLVACVVAGYLVGRVRGPAVGLLVAVAVRVALEPGAWPSYSTTLIAAALLLPAVGPRSVAAGLALASWLVSWTFPLDAAGGLTRLLLVVGCVAVAVRSAGRPPVPSFSGDHVELEPVSSSTKTSPSRRKPTRS